MSYTSFSPIEERFGFKTSGSFNCAYDNQRLIIMVLAGVIAFFAVACIIIFIMIYRVVTDVDIPTAVELAEALDQGANLREFIFGFDLAIYGSYMVAFIAGFILLIFSIVAYIVGITILRTGTRYTFTANEERFVIQPPETKEIKPAIIIYYKDVINVTATERKFLSVAHGMDVTIHCKEKDIIFRYIHTPKSKLNGITETPFHIIMERIGIVSRPDFHI